MIQIILIGNVPSKHRALSTACEQIFCNQPYSIDVYDSSDQKPVSIGKEVVVDYMNSVIEKARIVYPDAHYYIAMEGSIIKNGVSFE